MFIDGKPMEEEKQTQQKGTQLGVGRTMRGKSMWAPRKPDWLWNESTRYYGRKSEAWSWKGSSCSEVPKKRINPMFPPPPHTARQVLLQRGRDRGVEMEQNSSYAPAFTNTSPFPPRALDCWKPVIQPPGKRLENSPEKWMDPADAGIWGSTSENSSSQLNHPRLQDPVR